ncbi:angiopoietin-related protein 7-like [Drosophila willistoni]|uniref:angiopoietin-related protein 7-like n=1 Tax=Drosophila willistoni TaxID=7260 RepID=UPI001F079E28|nr:angiopoietin-related protein 7-like [Drosophila willistoni]
MRWKSVFPLVGLILVLGFQHVISESLLPNDNNRECGFSSDDKDLCALYCYRSMKLGLAYIIELKEKIKILEENHSGRENNQLSNAVEKLQSKIDQQNIQIANINDFITNSVRQKEVEEKAKSQTEIDNFNRKLEQLKENLENVQRQAAKDKEESLAEQKYLRNKIEQILRDKNTEIDGARNREIENLKEKLASQKSDLEKAVKDLESKNKEFEEYQTKEKNSNNKIGELNSKISSLQKNIQKEMEEKAKFQTEIDNFTRKVEQLKENLENVQLQAAKDKEGSLAEQRNRKREIENLKEKLATQNSDLHKAIKDLESKTKESKEYQTRENISSNKIGELNSKISSLKKSLEESETQLTDSNHLLERQLNQTAQNLIECREKLPKTSCKGLSSGIHKIEIAGLDPISALCEGDIEGGGWLVIHKRFDGSVDFNRTWTEYRNGFGNKEGEFFIGLDNLHLITNSQTYELYVQLGYHDGTFRFASYDNFTIGNETTKYKLESLGGFKGTAIDVMKVNLNQAFSSFDQDNDQWGGNCAQWCGAWWHRYCSDAHLNGKYFNREVDDYSSMSWWMSISLKSVQMLIRPK